MGLINSQMQGGRPPLPPKPPVANPAPPIAGAQPAAQPATGGEDPVVMRIVIAAKQALAQPQIAQQFVKMMQAAGDPVQGVARATTTLLRQLFVKSKGTMPLKALLPAAQKVLVDVARIGAAAKLFKITPDFLKQAAEATFEIMQNAYKNATQKQGQPGASQQQPAQPPGAAAPVAAAPMTGA